jgi:hypothetical protein
MSNAKHNETKAASPPKHPIAPDGRSELPKSNTDFPTPTGGGGGDPPTSGG